jgi:hypothetical protein
VLEYRTCYGVLLTMAADLISGHAALAPVEPAGLEFSAASALVAPSGFADRAPCSPCARGQTGPSGG